MNKSVFALKKKRRVYYWISMTIDGEYYILSEQVWRLIGLGIKT